MAANTGNSCKVYYDPIPVDAVYDHRDPSISVYHATGSITFVNGFQSADGDAFYTSIDAGTLGVQPATNQTGTADLNYNWTQATSFDENGNVIGDSKDFFDDMGRKIQVQDKSFYRAGANTTFTHVLASQPIRDAFGRDAATTLIAPIDYADFSYRPNFLLHNMAGGIYDHRNFDISASGDNTAHPDPIWDGGGNSPVKGTLAWYYNRANSWEPYVGVTSYPFSRQTFYQDGTGNAKQSAAPGDQLRIGLGREASSYITPVANELDFYMQVRNKYYLTSEVGALPANLAGQVMQQISRDANGVQMVVIQDRSGKTLMAARAGTDMSVLNTVTVLPVDPNNPDNATFRYFKLLATSAVNITGGSFTLYDMSSETPVSGFSSGSNLPAGYYKLSNTGTGTLTLTFSNSYSDISYSFYDQKGQLLGTIAPEGVKKLYGSGGAGLGGYATRNDIPYASQFYYDQQGRMIRSIDPDKGVSRYVYRQDGRIRFSQNSVQAISGSYSYTNYDKVNRAVESGQYDGNGMAFGMSGMTAILEVTDPGGGLPSAGVRTDVTQTIYDVPDNSHGLSWTQDATTLGGRQSLTRRYNTISNNSPSASNLVSATWSNYNAEGQTVWVLQYITGLGNGTTDAASYKKTDYTYDVLGHMIKRSYQAGQPDAFSYSYQYDPINMNLWRVYTSVGTAAPVLQATYWYSLTGELRRTELGSSLQGIDYTYTLAGSLKSINNSNKTQDPGGDGGGNGFPADAFGEVLDYFDGDYSNDRTGIVAIKGANVSSLSGTPLQENYAGNIKAMSWYSEKPVSSGLDNTTKAYVFQYDPKYQFVKSTWGNLSFSGATPTFSETTSNQERILNPTDNSSAYDGNGNIQYLQRTDGNGATLDAFKYLYGNSNNQLTSVLNTQTSQPYASYGYDPMGQMQAETLSDGTVLNLTYDVSGRVTRVTRGTGNTPVVDFVYDEGGKRIKKLSYNTSGQLIQVTFYLSDVVYTQQVTGGSSYGPVIAQEYLIKGTDRIGTYFPQISLYAYELKDHLGNVRAVVAQSGASYDVRSSSDYYPFGGAINQGGTVYRYGYQGQYAEKDPETGWNAFELRMYDSKIGRWLQFDPKGQFFSPYIGMGNDPVKGTDPDGGSTNSTIINESGKVVGGDINDGDLGIYQVNGLTKDNFDASKMAQYKADGVRVGESLFMTSFYFTEGKKWAGTIDLSSYAARDWLGQKIYTNTPSQSTYRSTYGPDGISEYDYKAVGYKPGMDLDEYHYRGSQIAPGVYASARDVGNIGAGYIGGHEGYPWDMVCYMFRARQWRQDNPGWWGWTSYFAALNPNKGEEPAGTVNPERYGYKLGLDAFIQERSKNPIIFKGYPSSSGGYYPYH